MGHLRERSWGNRTSGRGEEGDSRIGPGGGEEGIWGIGCLREVKREGQEPGR